MLCSHMREEDLRDVVTFCSAYRLLELTAAESISQIVIWREVGGQTINIMVQGSSLIPRPF